MNTYSYAKDQLDQLLTSIIQQNCNDDFILWLNEAASHAQDALPFTKFKIAFSLLARKLNPSPIKLSLEQKETLGNDFGLFTAAWDIQRLCRIWLILQIDASDKETYQSKINELFSNAEMNELATLYASLPVLAYPEAWTLRCAEGIRSNIGIVLDAIILNNPYPAQYLDENAWNQLILKAFFTEKDINQIIGIEKRANKNLAKSLKDYVEERQAANRPINEKLWALIKINELEKQ